MPTIARSEKNYLQKIYNCEKFIGKNILQHINSMFLDVTKEKKILVAPFCVKPL